VNTLKLLVLLVVVGIALATLDISTGIETLDSLLDLLDAREYV